MLRHVVQWKRRGGWQGHWFLHHNNAPSHTSLVVQQFLAEKNISGIAQTPYSPDLAPSDFCLFHTLNVGLKEIYFATMELNVTTEIQKIPKEALG
jgi:transposase